MQRLLSALEQQTFSREAFEVLVVDDGNWPPLAESLDGAAPGTVMLRQEQAGPAAARNLALAQARAETVLFLNADAVPPPQLIEQHVRAQRDTRRPTAILGGFDSTPFATTAFQRLCERGGLLFPYDLARPGVRLPAWFFWTCNLSVSTDVVRRAGGFDPAFRRPAWDDVELGYRVASLDVEIRYQPELECAHDHVFDLDAFRHRYLILGSEWVRVLRKYPVAAMAGALGAPFAIGAAMRGHATDWLATYAWAEPGGLDEILAVLDDGVQVHSPPRAVDAEGEALALLRSIATYHWLRGMAEAFDTQETR
jgi:glycosyltransferase involved in cell wall biosynthesis